MEVKPELIAFSQNKLGGVQNFYYNLLSNAPENEYDITWIFEDVNDADAKLPRLYGVEKETIFQVEKFAGETAYEMAKRLQELISEKEGIVLCNSDCELKTLHLYRRKNKTIFFICHDEGYLPFALQFEFLIDSFIAHNPLFYDEMIKVMPSRKNDVYYIPYGVKVPRFEKVVNKDELLKIVIAARMQVSKGVYDLPKIDDLLIANNVQVQWCIIGSGPEKRKLQEQVRNRKNFVFHSPVDNDEVIALMKGQDIFILPSRWDGLPVALIEAMSVGCVPVISEFNKGINRVITPEIGYVLPVDNLSKFADAISQLHYNRDLLRMLSVKAKRKVIEDYNIIVQSRKYFDLFAQFKTLKKPIRRKKNNYRSGWLDNPFAPRPIRLAIRDLKTRFFKQ